MSGTFRRRVGAHYRDRAKGWLSPRRDKPHQRAKEGDRLSRLLSHLDSLLPPSPEWKRSHPAECVKGGRWFAIIDGCKSEVAGPKHGDRFVTAQVLHETNPYTGCRENFLQFDDHYPSFAFVASAFVSVEPEGRAEVCHAWRVRDTAFADERPITLAWLEHSFLFRRWFL